MKKFFIFLIPCLKLIGLPLIHDVSYAKEKIREYANGYNIPVYVNSRSMGNVGYNDCNFLTNGENLVLKTFVKKNDNVIDVGANVGNWTRLVMHSTDFQCKIYGFEPVPLVYNRLKEACKQFGDSVCCFNVALGRQDESLEMNYFEEESELSTMYYRPVLAKFSFKKIIVPVTSLDKFANEQNIAHINFLKIDTEGSELNVLIGAKNLIQNNAIDAIQFEYGGCYLDAGTTLSEIYNYLCSNRYMIFRIISDGLVYIPDWDQELENFQYSNYLAIKNVSKDLSSER